MAVIEPNSIPEGLAFDDVLLRPGLSAVMPSATNIGTQLTRAIRLNLPIISAAISSFCFNSQPTKERHRYEHE